MSKTTLTLTIILMIIIVATVAYFGKVVDDDVQVQIHGSADVQVESTNAGKYIEYSPELLAEAEGDIVLFFNAVWCPTCRAFKRDLLKNISDIPEGLTIFSVDYDSYTDLKKKYKIRYQHTYVQLGKDGEQIKQWSGSPTLAEFIKELTQ